MMVSGAYSVFLRYAKLWSAYEQGCFASPSDDWPPSPGGGTTSTTQSDNKAVSKAHGNARQPGAEQV